MDAAVLTRRLAELGHEVVPGPEDVPVLAPTSAQQAADLLGTCTREGWRVRLSGAGTRGTPAPPADLTVSARALTGFDIYEPDDLTVGVRAGTTHDEAARELARHRQLLPLDPPGPAAATLGGSFATGSAGPLRAAYGTPRDLALGTTVAAADGRLLRLGGQVVKNVAGYDLVRLVVGSRGTLGLITQVHVRLRSLPPSDVTVLADVPDPAAAAGLAIQIRDEVSPVALELLSPAVAGDSWQLAIRLHGSADATGAALPAVQRALPSARVLTPEAAAAFWHELGTAETTASTRLRCTALPTALPALVANAIESLNFKSGNTLGTWRAAAHATEGILRIWAGDGGPPGDGALAGALAELEQRIASVNGTCICDRGPESLRTLLPGPEPSPRVRELERELRLRFDPASILVGV